jgi:hypothetical protein
MSGLVGPDASMLAFTGLAASRGAAAKNCVPSLGAYTGGDELERVNPDGRVGSEGRPPRPRVLDTVGLLARAAAARRSVSLEFGEPFGESLGDTLGEPTGESRGETIGEPRGEAVRRPPMIDFAYAAAGVMVEVGRDDSEANKADVGVVRRVDGGKNDFCWVTIEEEAAGDEVGTRQNWTR